MKRQISPAKRMHPEEDLASFEAAGTRLEERLDKLGITEKDLLDAAAKVRERMLTEVYGLEAEELVQP
jgi:hypothetical protein